MNKKGFTLVELLAVIVILALLAVVANSSVTNVVKNSKSDLYNTQIELIVKAAETWGLDNIDRLPNEGECAYLKLKDLSTYGLFEETIINPKTNQPFSEELKIKITSKINNQGMLKSEYEVDPKSISNCTEVYPPICTLVNDTDNNNKITPGDEYTCTVKENTNYTFYVLSENDNGTTNLIMDKNICEDGTVATADNTCLVAWYADDFYNSFGPVTAMNYLNKATSTWSNVPNLNITYTDEGGRYGTIQITGKARLPYLSEVEDYKSDGTNRYLYDYLTSYNNIQLNPISGIAGYWTLSSLADGPSNAWYVRYDGGVSNDHVDSTVDYNTYGVRPVITLTLD